MKTAPNPKATSEADGPQTASPAKQHLSKAISQELYKQAFDALQENSREQERMQLQLDSLRRQRVTLYKQLECIHDEGFTGTNDGIGGYDVETCNKCKIERIY